MSLIPQFPSTNSIPPAQFFDIYGLAQWLNMNPTYKQYFTGVFPNLVRPTSTLSSAGYDPENVPLCSNVRTLASHQAREYQSQVHLFQNIYAYNSNAYVNYLDGNTLSPIYYTFSTFQEQMQYRSAVALINKLYPFQDMANRVGWITPFPVYM
jgi:hypothetical protein